MSAKIYPIPGRLNICLATFVILSCATLLWASGQVHSWWAVAALAVIYGFVMNTGYALCHEAEHDIFHPNKMVNDVCGSIVTLFFPASFQLRRQGHLGHHLRNRTDDEAFDLYFEGENPVWKWLQFYGILTGFFWLVIVISNFIAVINPQWLAMKTNLDRPTAALQETLNPKYFRLLQLEAFLVLLLHGAMIYFFKIPILHYFAVLCGFGFIWSTLQYIHHYDTPRDVQKGASNVRTWRVFDLIWLNHHWHLNHHLAPTVPWIYLPKLESENAAPIPFWKAYFRQWRGPRFTFERVTNRHAGKFVR
ncbi:MAG TPA: fatty acid desaturase [Verrucomicrobiae bacterium]|nr:fatty acid desaturase [Verrucomicrobiae bacterium]